MLHKLFLFCLGLVPWVVGITLFVTVARKGKSQTPEQNAELRAARVAERQQRLASRAEDDLAMAIALAEQHSAAAAAAADAAQSARTVTEAATAAGAAARAAEAAGAAAKAALIATRIIDKNADSPTTSALAARAEQAAQQAHEHAEALRARQA